MPLILARRTAKLGNSLQVNTQKHGQEDVSALDLVFKGLPLTPEDLGEVLLEPKAYKLLYRKWKGRPDEPMFKPVLTLPVNGKVKSVSATLFLGRRRLEIINATMSKMMVELKGGGISLLNFGLRFVPDLDENHPIMENLFSKVNQSIDLELSCEGYGSEPELPLEEPEEDEGAEGEETED